MYGGYSEEVVEEVVGIGESPTEAKNRQKRAANRKSAQLSRLRKKRYIEELATEYTHLKVLLYFLVLKLDSSSFNWRKIHVSLFPESDRRISSRS